jgi:hypothetical protein
MPKHALPILAIACALGAAAPASAQPVTYENAVKAVIAERCTGCHGAGAPTMEEFKKDEEGWKKKFKGPKMDSYASLMVMVKGSDAGAIMRRLDDGKVAAKPGNMYAYLGTSDAQRAENLGKFKAWVGTWSLKRRKELSDAELGAITAPEK